MRGETLFTSSIAVLQSRRTSTTTILLSGRTSMSTVLQSGRTSMSTVLQSGRTSTPAKRSSCDRHLKEHFDAGYRTYRDPEENYGSLSLEVRERKHNSDGMRNVKKGDFGKARLGNGEILDVTGMGDVDLITTLGTTWTLSNVRIIPKLETKVISVGQLDEEGLDVKFGGGKWRVVKNNLVIARGFKKGSLYLALIPSGDVTTPVKTNARIGLADSRAKRVRFVAMNSGAPVNQLERIRKSERGRGFRNSGSNSTQFGNQRWVRKTKEPNENVSPGKLLLLDSVPLGISGSDAWGSDGIEDVMRRSVETGLGPSGAPTGPSVY
ncbi:hypothetical protein QVD17_29843 [Tagetes erecta]|uniref:Retrovirus-related Pol polyprotein from transposon TNT 1-94-like beta-barrel domain-containing protein n=1 Tax=Tagetes erecta TaxID=13708 RepID=A0AAD8K4G7_TARER|nr:hypothetical protein QVD17_29843 [Tagetes erecta]